MADEAIYRPESKTLSPEMDAWLKRARKKQPEPEPSINEIMNAPRRAAAYAIQRAVETNSKLILPNDLISQPGPTAPKPEM